MKKVEKYIYLVIILILIVVVACSITYAITISNNNNENNNEQIDNGSSNNNESNSDDESNEEEQITLSENELEDYLRYIPNDIMNEEQSVYKNPTTVNTMTTSYVLGATLNYASNYTDLRETTSTGDEFYYPEEEIISLAKKLYNKDITILNNSDNIANFSCSIYSYQDSQFFESGGCGYDGVHFSKISSYEATEEELIIYEYAAYANYVEGDDYMAIMYDYYTDEENYLGMPCPNTDNDISCYFEENLNDYTLYKYT